jgi:antitoxin VapB
MAISLKNPKTEELARALAAETGETITEAIFRAVQERLERVRGRRTAPNLAEQLLEISRRCQSLPDIDTRSAEEILGYDESGAFR